MRRNTDNPPAGREERTLPADSPELAGDDSNEPTRVRKLPVLSRVSDHDATGEAAEPEPDAGSTAAPAEKQEPPQPATPPAGARHRPRWAKATRFAVKVALWLAAFPLLCILPFIVVLRISVSSYQQNTLAGWEAMGLGMLSAVAMVCLYIIAFMLTFRIPKRFFMGFLNIGLAAMLCYTGFALFHLATTQAKTEEIRSYYTSLHPFLRVAIKNLAVIDDDLIITDVHRTRADYEQMGLEPRDYSLHFRQPTGFVHAVDIRTIGRSKITNLFVELYFILMGFETIRHVGTADHLHVALPVGERAAKESGADVGG